MVIMIISAAEEVSRKVKNSTQLGESDERLA